MALDAYAVFVAEITQASAKLLTHGLTAVSNDQAAHLHLLMQSTGGTVQDGVYMYNLFRTYPKPLTVYNAGSIASAAAIAFLGAPSRLTHRHGTFMIHRVQAPALPSGITRLAATTKSLKIDDERADAILKEHVSLSPRQWRMYNTDFLWLSAKEAVAASFATGYGDFAPPRGSRIYDFG